MMKMILTRAGIIGECVECQKRFSADEMGYGHDCEAI
jgi:hypothetical protein